MRQHRFGMTVVAVGALVAVGAWSRQPLRGEWVASSSWPLQSASPSTPSPGSAFQSGDLYRLKSVGDVQMSPDATRIAYSVQNNDRPGRPYSQVWIMDVATG